MTHRRLDSGLCFVLAWVGLYQISSVMPSLQCKLFVVIQKFGVISMNKVNLVESSESG